MMTSKTTLDFCVFLQGCSDQSAFVSQYPGADVSRWQHLHHLLCGGPFSEIRAGETGADAVGKEWGTEKKSWAGIVIILLVYPTYNAVSRNQSKLRPATDPTDEAIDNETSLIMIWYNFHMSQEQLLPVVTVLWKHKYHLWLLKKWKGL